MLNKRVSKAIYFLFSILLFFTPLIFVTNTNELFEFPKMFFVYFVGLTIIFLFTVNQILDPKKVIYPDKIIGFFVLAYFISTIFSFYKYTSLWGYYTRFNGGLISVLVFFGLYFVVLNQFNKEEFRKLLFLPLLSLIPISIYAIMQHYEFIGDMWKVSPAIRAFSTLGQPNWLAGYISMLIPILFFYIFSTSRVNKGQKGFFIVIYLLAFSALWFAYSLSGLLGFGVGILAFLALNKNALVKRNVPVFMVLLIMSTAIMLLNPGIFKERIQDTVIDIKKITSLEKVALAQEVAQGETYQISDPGNIRKGLWKGTVNLILSSPKNLLVGTGPETFPYAFQPFRVPELNYTSEWDFIFNKPHNYYLELLSNLGLVGFTPYIIIIFKTLKEKNKLLTPALLAFYVTNIFSWPTVSTALLFWMFLADIFKEDTFQ